ncbi:putative leucine-rich repeat-containing protein DDB_G0290503 [Apis laboriosa]|uniref:putative leucine-rich repeat-containing protein DDB_G0290503 n=1 Tax=Apis laboriosa TaxID=183418 RepID=UPI001CC66808|nr:putative leucine-rich repeat-containing protein DDB_G0290503 [Apis laboriosa]
MESNEITWKLVPNTVASRMIDFSLIHKLVPSRKIRQRNKAMNIAIKQFQSLKSYSQYIKMKTSILRNLSDDSETDDNVSFTEDDYSILYKSDLSLTDYIMQMSNKNEKYTYESEFETNKDNIVSNSKTKKTYVEKRKRKSSETINLGWQKIIKKRIKDSSFETKKTNINDLISSNVTSSLINANTQDNFKIDANCSKESILNLSNEMSINNEIYTAEKIKDKCSRVPDSNKVKHDTIVVHETISKNNELEVSNLMMNNIDEKFHSNENYSYKLFDDSNTETVKEIKKEMASLSDHINENQNPNDSCINKNILLIQNNCNQSEKNLIRKELKDQLLIIGNTYQPKDSGIEEDSEEEISDHKKKHYKKVKNTIQNTEQNISTTTSPQPTINYKNNMIDCDNNSERHMLNKSDIKDIILHVDKNINEIEYKKKIEKHKVQPKVTHTEIVNRKYKIICDTSAFDNHSESEELDFHDENYEIQEAQQIMEDSISSNKRLQQLRRLNLTIDSNSSLSDNDDTYCNVENMRNKLFERSKESVDTLNSEDEDINSKHEISMKFDEKLQNNDKYIQHKSNSLNNAISHNFNKKQNVRKLNKKNLKIKCTVQSENAQSSICDRPCNLQELIEKESLVLETTIPSFTLKDIEEDDVFIIDIPSTVLESELIGNKIVLTDKKLKLGKKKYKVECKSIDNTSWVFASGKVHKPYKIVNIKPMIRAVTGEKIT